MASESGKELTSEGCGVEKGWNPTGTKMYVIGITCFKTEMDLVLIPL